MDAKERIKEIDNMTEELRAEREQLKQAIIKEQQNKLQRTVGMCFRSFNGDLQKIIKVPQIHELKFGIDFNPYQLPILVLTAKNNFENDPIGIEENTLFSRAIDSVDVVKHLMETNEVITEEEFNEELEKRFEKIRNLGK